MAELLRGRPADHGVDARGVLAFLDALEDHEHIEPHSVMLLRHGEVIAEGWWSPYTAGRAQLLYSLSKSFTSSAVGLAVAEGLMSLDAPVVSYFPELAGDVTDQRTRRMLVRHLLAMASGHRGETLDLAARTDPGNIVRGFLATPPDEEPGTTFAYNQPCTYTLAEILTRVSGSGLVDYLRPRLLDPLGIGAVAWVRDGSGHELGFSGLHATTDAVARLGQLYLQRGQWEGRQLLSSSWVAEATRLHVANAEATNADWRQGYGFQFWMARHGFRGDGAYGQFCVVLPDHDVVLAITSATYAMQDVLDAAWEHLLPAFDGAVDPDADVQLAERLSHVSLPPVSGDAVPGEGWDGFRATTGAIAREVRVTRTRDGWVLGLADDPSVGDPLSLRVPLGVGAWAVSDEPVPLATSGGWRTPETLVVDVLFLETPHRLRLTCRLGRPTAEAAWATQAMGAGRLAELAAPWQQK